MERKARFIAQIKTGDLDARTVDDIGSDDLGNAAAATKAVATGDPRHLEQVALDDDVKRLGALKRAHGDAQWRHRDEQKQYSKEVTATTAQLEAIDAALPAIRASANDPFAMTIAGTRYTERADAAPAFLHAAQGAYTQARQHGASRSFPVAQLRGVEVRATRFLSTDDVMFELSIPSRSTSVSGNDLYSGTGVGMGLLRRMENLVRGTEEHRGVLEHRYDLAVRRIGELAAVADTPFEHAGELADKQHQLEMLTAQLHIESSGPEAQAAAEAAQQRMQAMGREPGYSLRLNPTPAMMVEMGVDPVAYKESLKQAGRGSREPGARAPATRDELSAAQDAVRRAMASHPGGVGRHTQQPQQPAAAADATTPRTGTQASEGDLGPAQRAARLASLSHPRSIRQQLNNLRGPTEDTQAAPGHAGLDTGRDDDRGR